MPKLPQPKSAGRPGLWFCNWKLWLGARQVLEGALAPLDLRPREFWIFAILTEAAVSQHELANVCGVDPSSMVALLDDLESRGLVRRRRNPDDRRVHLISLTVHGQTLYSRALPLARKAESKQLSPLAPADRRRLLQLLQKLARP